MWSSNLLLFHDTALRMQLPCFEWQCSYFFGSVQEEKVPTQGFTCGPIRVFAFLLHTVC